MMKTVKQIKELPQKCVTIASRKGAQIALKSAKKGRWIDQSGNLRKGIILKGERRTVVGKKVYQVTMDSRMNDIFQKFTKTGMVRGTGKKKKLRKGNYYYPASQEYGFRTVNGKYIPGFHFLHDGLVDNTKVIQNTIVQVLSKEFDKLK